MKTLFVTIILSLSLSCAWAESSDKPEDNGASTQVGQDATPDDCEGQVERLVREGKLRPQDLEDCKSNPKLEKCQGLDVAK